MQKSSMIRLLIVVSLMFANFARAADNESDTARTNTSTLPKAGPITSKEELKPHFGLLAGSVHPEGSYDPGMGYGFEIGYQPYIPFGAGLELTRSRNIGRKNLENIDQTAVLLRGTYNFGGSNFFISHTFAGLVAGSVFKSSHSDIAAGPVIGFDLPVQQKVHNYITVGANAKYLAINGNDPDNVTINGAVKYWY